jgi:hypothetical protein
MKKERVGPVAPLYAYFGVSISNFVRLRRGRVFACVGDSNAKLFLVTRRSLPGVNTRHSNQSRFQHKHWANVAKLFQYRVFFKKIVG